MLTYFRGCCQPAPRLKAYPECYENLFINQICENEIRKEDSEREFNSCSAVSNVLSALCNSADERLRV